MAFLTLHVGENVADCLLERFDFLLRTVRKFDVVEISLTVLQLLGSGQKQVARFGDHLVSGLVFTVGKEKIRMRIEGEH